MVIKVPPYLARFSNRTLYTAAALIILILCATLLIVFNYFDIVPLSKNNPERLGFLPTKKAATATGFIVDAPTPPSNTRPAVYAVRRHPSYNLVISDNEGLIKFFKDLGIWGKRFNPSAQQDTLPVNTAIIFLSNDENQINIYKDKDGKHLFSYTLSFTGNMIYITVFLPQNILTSPQASQTFTSAILYAASKINTDVSPGRGPESFDKNFFEILPLGRDVPFDTQPRATGSTVSGSINN